MSDAVPMPGEPLGADDIDLHKGYTWTHGNYSKKNAGGCRLSVVSHSQVWMQSIHNIIILPLGSTCCTSLVKYHLHAVHVLCLQSLLLVRMTGTSSLYVLTLAVHLLTCFM